MRPALLTLLLATVAQANERPNVLLILADDLGYSDLGCYGGEVPTPHLDALAADGLRFTQATTSARCCPTRASLLTGLHPHQAGVGSFATRKPDRKRGPAYLGHLNEGCATLAEVLGGAGYSTWMVGKWHVGLPGPIERGFEEFYGFTQGYEQDQWEPDRYQRLPEGREPELGTEDFFATDAFSDYALEFLSQAREDERPWFLYLAHGAPHFPVQAPPATTATLVERYRAGWDDLREARFERQRASGLATDAWSLSPRSLVPVDRADLASGYPGQPNPAWDTLDAARREDLAYRMAVFAAMVSHVDQGVGRLVRDLEAHGELEDTLIVFLSDNGACYEWGPFGFDGPSRRAGATLHTAEDLARMGGPGTYHAYGSAWANLGNTPLRLYKHFAHEGGLATPLVMHWPARVDAPRWVRDPAHVMDLMPTLVEACGATYPSGRTPLEGLSLVPTFDGEALPPRELCWEHQGARAVRRGRWKAVWGKRYPQEVRWELYDLEVDRCETRDLAAKHPTVVEELREAWLAWARRVGVAL